MKVIVAGGRDFSDIPLMDGVIKHLAAEGWLSHDGTTLVCGMARGADLVGYHLWHDAYGLPIQQLPADWDRLGKRAGYVRNTQMAQEADKLIAFWDGQSRGTKHMIDTMQRLNKPVHIVRY